MKNNSLDSLLKKHSSSQKTTDISQDSGSLDSLLKKYNKNSNGQTYSIQARPQNPYMKAGPIGNTSGLSTASDNEYNRKEAAKEWNRQYLSQIGGTKLKGPEGQEIETAPKKIGVLQSIGRGLIQSTGGAIERTGLGLAKAFTDKYSPETSKKLDKIINIKDRSDQQLAKDVWTDDGKYDARELANLAGSGIGSVGMSIGLAMVNPSLVVPVFGVMQGSDTYIDAKKAGKSNNEALSLAAIDGTISGLLEKVGINFMFGKYWKSLKPLAKVPLSMVGEIGQELAQNTASNSIAKLGYDDSRKIFEGTMDTIIATAFGAGAGMGATKIAKVKGVKSLQQDFAKKGVSIDTNEANIIYDKLTNAIDQKKSNFDSIIDKEIKSRQELVDLKKKQETSIDDGKMLDNQMVQGRLVNDIVPKLQKNGVSENVLNEIKVLPTAIDSPGKFYTMVSGVLKKHNEYNPKNILELKATTRDFNMALKDPSMDSGFTYKDRPLSGVNLKQEGMDSDKFSAILDKVKSSKKITNLKKLQDSIQLPKRKVVKKEEGKQITIPNGPTITETREGDKRIFKHDNKIIGEITKDNGLLLSDIKANAKIMFPTKKEIKKPVVKKVIAKPVAKTTKSIKTINKLSNDLEKQGVEKRIKEYTNTIKKIYSSDTKQQSSALKGVGMEMSAVKRKILGTTTPKEKANARKRLESNYVGKDVVIGNLKAKVIGTAFGKIRVEFPNGTTKSVAVQDIKPKPVTDNDVNKYLKQEGLKTLESKETIYQKPTKKSEVKKKVVKKVAKPVKETIETLDEKITAKVEAFRRSNQMMAETYVGIGLGEPDTHGRRFSSLKNIKRNMSLQARNFKKEAYKILYENDPEFKKLVDKLEKLEDKNNEIDIDTIQFLKHKKDTGRPEVLDRVKITGKEATKQANRLIRNLKLNNINQQVLDVVLDDNGQEAFAVALANTLYFTQEVPEYAGVHELIHIIHQNVDKIKLFTDNGITKKKLDDALKLISGSRDIKEVLAENGELKSQYKASRGTGIINKLIKLVKGWMDKLINRNPRIVNDFLELVLEGRAKEYTTLQIKKKPIIKKVAGKSTLDLTNKKAPFIKKAIKLERPSVDTRKSIKELYREKKFTIKKTIKTFKKDDVKTNLLKAKLALDKVSDKIEKVHKPVTRITKKLGTEIKGIAVSRMADIDDKKKRLANKIIEGLQDYNGNAMNYRKLGNWINQTFKGEYVIPYGDGTSDTIDGVELLLVGLTKQNTTYKGKQIAKVADATVIKQLKAMEGGDIIIENIKNLADENHANLVKTFEKDIQKLDDYFYGDYKDTAKVKRVLDHYKSTQKSKKKKTFLGYGDAYGLGLRLKDGNPVSNLLSQTKAIAMNEALLGLKRDGLKMGFIQKLGKGVEIREGYKEFKDPVISGYAADETIVDYIDNITEADKTNRVSLARGLKAFNRKAIAIMFIGSAFHLINISMQTIVDTPKIFSLQGFKDLGRAYKQSYQAMKGMVRELSTVEKKMDKYVNSDNAIQKQAKDSAQKFIDSLISRDVFGVATNSIRAGLNFLPNLLFDHLIPRIKLMKAVDAYNHIVETTGNEPTLHQIQEIATEQQNIYGMMNEKILYGRNSTSLSLIRFLQNFPGFSEGNINSIARAFKQTGSLAINKVAPTINKRFGTNIKQTNVIEGDKGTFKQLRSINNVYKVVTLGIVVAQILSIALTGKPPREKKDEETVADYLIYLMSVRTNVKDKYGNDIVHISTAIGKDYVKFASGIFSPIKEGPTVAVDRFRGTISPSAKMITDIFGASVMGKPIVDYKGDRITDKSDSGFKRFADASLFEIKRFMPYSVNSYVTSRAKGLSALHSIASAVGSSATTEEYTKKQNKSRILLNAKKWDERRYFYNEREIDEWNADVERLFKNKYIDKQMKEDFQDLFIDKDVYLQNKIYDLTSPSLQEDAENFDEKKRAKIQEILLGFDITYRTADQILADYWNRKEKEMKNPNSLSHKRTVRERENRLKKLF